MLSFPDVTGAFFGAIPATEFTSGTSLLGHLLCRRVALRCGLAVAVLGLWRFWPTFERRVVNSPTFPRVREWASWRWIAFDLSGLALDLAAVRTVFEHTSQISETFKQTFAPTWQHAYHISKSNPSWLVPRIPALSLSPAMDTAFHARLMVPAHARDILVLQLASSAKVFVAPLLRIAVARIDNTNVMRTRMQVAAWFVEYGAHFATRCLVSRLWGRLDICEAHPRASHAVLTVTLSVCGQLVASIVNGAMENWEINRLQVQNKETVDSALATAENRTRCAQLMVGFEDWLLSEAESGVGPMSVIEPRQLTAVFLAGVKMIGARRLTHASRYGMMTSLRNLSFYIDACERGEMENGAAEVLPDFSRKVTFAAARGVESSVSSLRLADQSKAAGPTTEEPVHTQSCAVCIADYEDGDELAELVCGHLFHHACVREWLTKHKECPLCRHDIRAAMGAAQAEPTFSDAAVMRAWLRAWSSRTLPHGLDTGKWGDVTDLSRTHQQLIPEGFLHRQDREFEAPFAAANAEAAVGDGGEGFLFLFGAYTLKYLMDVEPPRW